MRLRTEHHSATLITQYDSNMTALASQLPRSKYLLMTTEVHHGTGNGVETGELAFQDAKDHDGYDPGLFRCQD